MKNEYRYRPSPSPWPLLTTPSRWVAVVASKQHDAGEAISDEQSISDVSHTTGAQSLRKGLPPLDLATIKDFLRYIASVSDGLIDTKGLVTTDSLNTFGEWFFAGFARVTGNRIEAEDRHSVYDVSTSRIEIYNPS